MGAYGVEGDGGRRRRGEKAAGWQAHSGDPAGPCGEEPVCAHTGCTCVTPLSVPELLLARERALPPGFSSLRPSLSLSRAKLAPPVLEVPKALKVLAVNLVLLGPLDRPVPL